MPRSGCLTAALVDELCAGGIDFIKDDELQADGPRCAFEARFAAVMDVIDRHADRTGRKVMYAVNLTGEIDEMKRRHDIVAARGGTCVVVSLNSVGPTGLTALRKVASLPIHAHRNGWGILGRAPDSGWTYPAWSTIWRLAGADHMHVNGIANKFWEPDESVIASARFCHTPLTDIAALLVEVFSDLTCAPAEERPALTLDQIRLLKSLASGHAPDDLEALPVCYDSLTTLERSILRVLNARSLFQAVAIAASRGLLEIIPFFEEDLFRPDQHVSPRLGEWPQEQLRAV